PNIQPAPAASSRWPLAELPLVLDEFTSSLDRTIAKTASAAVSRFLRRDDAGSVVNGRRLVALTCHDDILPWLAPDWILELGGGQPRLARCGPEPLELPLRVGRVPQAMWREFAGQHYLAGGLAASATCYAAWWEDCCRDRPPWRSEQRNRSSSSGGGN